MKRFALNRALAAAALGVAAAMPASAGVIPGVIDFESVPVNVFFAGDTFTESGFRMTVDFDFGTVDNAVFLPAPTSGNNTQVYFNSNDGGLIIERDDGLGFNLNSFDYAKIPQNPAGALATALVAIAEDMDGNQMGFGFAFAAAVNNAYPFATVNTTGLFNNLRWVGFFGCSLVGNQLCTAPTQNGGQFALDNLNVVTIPEPTSIALVLSALLAAGFSARRNVR